MRVNTVMIFSQSVNNVMRHYENFFDLNESVSSGKKVNRPSDDPVDMGKILGYRTVGDAIKQYERNLNNGIALLNNTESSLANAEEIVMNAKVLAEQMATGTYTADQREMLSEQVENYIDDLIILGNTRISGRAIFSGYKTDTQTFTRDEYYNVSYHGDNHKINFEISESTYVAVNTTGQEAFMDGTNVFDVLRDLRNALQDNHQHGVQRALEQLNESMQQVIQERASVGTSLAQMNSAKMTLVDFAFQTETLLSETEDTDMIDALTRLEQSGIAFEATLKSTAMITNLNLVNYV
ncbi:MAG: flagellar hook-associated protein 3 [Deltaproteobacteria bacterium]|nr:flagellar hook-associated protein 3 [Deltaproteobacteria bacterium]